MRNDRFIVGLTGGIATGKTSICDEFNSFIDGPNIISCDDIVRKLSQPGCTLNRFIDFHFGSNFILPDGSIDKQKFKSFIFNNEQSRILLETISFPLIYEKVIHSIDNNTYYQPCPYTIIEAPLLLACKPLLDLVDFVLISDCPTETQLERVMQRDGIDEQMATAIIKSQPTSEVFKANSDGIIVTNHNIISQVHYYHNLFKILKDDPIYQNK